MRYATARLLLLVLAACAGCASGESYVREGYDFGQIRSVAVADVSGTLRSEAAKNEIADFFFWELLRKGYDPIERRQVRTILTEQEFQQTDFASPQGAAELGRIANVQAIIVVNLPVFDEEHLDMTAKLIDVEDGRILWMGSGKGSTGRGVMTVMGAAVGGLTGWALVHGREENRQAGAVGGAVLGGAGGYALSPQKEELARKAIRGMFESFPPRGHKG